MLKAERLTVHEIDVFRAVVHWAERKVSEENLAATAANRRGVLGEALYLIHLPAVSVEEFTKIVVPAGILDIEEENAMFRLLLGGGGSCGNGSGCSGSATSSNLSKTAGGLQQPFPLSSRNFVTTRCDIAYDGFVRHNVLGTLSASSSSRFQSQLPQGSRWSLALYCDHSIKVHEIGFFGQMRGHVSVTQNGYRKLDVHTHSAGVQNIRFGDDLHLDAGQFTVATDAPFAYVGEYFSKGAATGASPVLTTDHDKVNILLRDASPLCFVAYIIFVPTDEIYFIENYYNDESVSSSSSASSSVATMAIEGIN